MASSLSSFSIEEITALITAAGSLIGFIAKRYWPSRKRLDYREQLNTPIGMIPEDAHGLVQLRLLREGRAVADASIALLKVENVGHQYIAREDINSPLTFVFEDRTIVGVEVSAVSEPALRSMLTEHHGLQQYTGGRLIVPRVPLNSKEHFKLLVLLSGTGRTIKVEGHIGGGRIARGTNRRGPRSFTIGLIVLLTASLTVLATSLTNEPQVAEGKTCVSGTLDVAGSTAFAPAVRRIAEAYMKDCHAAEIVTEAKSSLQGIQDLNNTAKSDPAKIPARIAVSDGEDPAHYPNLDGHTIGVAVFSVVVNPATGVDNLTTAQLRDIYSGKTRNWNKLGGPNQQINIIGRYGDSGTRRIFQNKVLGGTSELPASSYNCTTKGIDASSPVVRCELGTTEELLDEVGRTPGAIGYAELSSAKLHQNIHRIQLNAHDPDLEAVQHGDYPYWTVEYFYTYGEPKDGTLVDAFLDFMRSDAANNIMRSLDHVPCVDQQSEAEALCQSEKPEN